MATAVHTESCERVGGVSQENRELDDTRRKRYRQAQLSTRTRRLSWTQLFFRIEENCGARVARVHLCPSARLMTFSNDEYWVGSERLHLRRFLVTYSDPRHHFPPTPSTHPKAAPCGRTSRRCTTSIRTSQLLDRAENGRLPCDHKKKAALHSRRLALTVFRRLPCQDESYGTRQDIVTAPRG